MDNMLSHAMLAAGLAAAKEITRQKADGSLQVYRKEVDGIESVVTSADFAANAIIFDALKIAAPDVPIISEEGAPKTADYSNYPEKLDIAKHHSRYFVIDPLDGTGGFVKGHACAVNIALVEDGKPVLGVVVLPSLGVAYFSDEHGKAYKYDIETQERQPIQVRKATPAKNAPVTVIQGYKQDPQRLLAQLPITIGNVEQGVNAERICRVAEGAGDACFSMAFSNLWDTAAPDAILRAAGGQLLAIPHAQGVVQQRTDLQPLRYDADAMVALDGKTYPLANMPYIGGGSAWLKQQGLSASMVTGLSIKSA